ncbi:uncharacterized protein LOC143541329 [Bidens hawaiensis]|uniref:uncharacterized protein LOC143541329 n=1 Tax=Bidens hawaiensis TaxID=980011 RepID=UPI00404A0DA7
MCHAKLWKDEARRGRRPSGNNVFFICCSYGKVQLPKLKKPPPDYISLFSESDAKSKFFLKNIRRYNSMFSFTSMGGKIDKSINKGNAPFIFRLSGQNYHSIGSLLPATGSKPKFAQLYIYDTDNEVSNRQSIFDQSANDNSSTSNVLDVQIINQLKHMLDTHNELVKCYRMVRDCFSENPTVDLKLRLIGKRENDARTYNLPSASEVAALIVGDIGDCIDNRDIIVQTQEVYTVEFQKRGLPHVHICLFMHPDNKFPTVEHIDPLICAEIPEKNEDPELYTLVSDFMIHGPCGADNMKCSSMVNKRCSKKFPKKFRNETCVDTKGFPQYRRRDSGNFVAKSDVKLDNRSVVPYNQKLLRKYQGHINVEWCNQSGSIKYLFKYINKGPDQTTVTDVKNSSEDDQDEGVDEIKEYYDCRYLSACEAAWRIFSYDIHYRYPPVMRLPFHLPDKQQVFYGPDVDVEDVLDKDIVASTMFTSWMECNQIYDEAKELNYIEFLSKFVWKKEGKCWERRKLGFSIGRIHSVSPALGEAYFLRILLNKVKGPTSFEDIRTVNGMVFPTFRDACYEHGLLDDDMEYIEAIKEASNSGSGGYLRNLFATMLTSHCLSRPDFVWEKVGKFCLMNKDVFFLEITKAVEINKGGVFFVYGYGGTGKTFLWMILSASIRSKGQIVLNVASSGIASLLLTRGRTAHSRFHIPINLNEDSNCTIKPGIDDAQLVSEAKLIIWDEAPMIHKHAFEALDRTLKDVLNYDTLAFGGKVIVFGGDFRQILPIVQNGSRQDIVNSSLSSSYLWSECKVLRLTKNMRLNVVGDSTNMEQTKLFAQWLLDLGEGKVGGTNDGEAIIEIPDDLLINDSLDPVSELINFVYPSILSNYMQPNFFEERALLAPTNEVVQEINDRLLSMFLGDEKEYLSLDSICQEEYLNENFDESLYSKDILNGLKISGLPNHKLVLKVGVSVMLLRNLDQKGGLCNGTTLQVTSLGNRVIKAQIISGTNIGEPVFIHRTSLTPTDKKIPFKFQQRQLSLAVYFAMTINKSQGQSLSRVGLFLKEPVFSHGQLYVALSRVKSRDGLKLLIFDKDGNVTNTTKNVVYKELFSKSNHLFCEVRYPKSKPKSQLLTVQMTKCQKRLAA